MNPSPPATLSILCLLMSAMTFLLMASDKAAAKRRAHRIPEKVLFLFAILLGAPGGTLGMLLCRHKTKHLSFRIFFPLLALLQILILILFHIKQ